MRLLLVSTEADPLRQSFDVFKLDVASGLARALRELDHEVDMIVPSQGEGSNQNLQDPSAHWLDTEKEQIAYTHQGFEQVIGMRRARVSGDIHVVFAEHSELFIPLLQNAKNEKSISESTWRAANQFVKAISTYVQEVQDDIDAVIFIGWIGALCMAHFQKQTQLDSTIQKAFIYLQGECEKKIPSTKDQLLPLEQFIKENQTVDFVDMGRKIADYTLNVQSPTEFSVGNLTQEKKPQQTEIILPFGMDTSLWNPATNSWLHSRFDPFELSGKKDCKSSVQSYLGFERSNARPLLYGMSVSRKKTTLHLLSEILSALLEHDLQMIWSMDAELAEEPKLKQLMLENPEKLKIDVLEDSKALHTNLAASDVTLVLDSEFEVPPELSLMAQCYGSIPIRAQDSKIKIEQTEFDKSTGWVWNLEKTIDPHSLQNLKKIIQEISQEYGSRSWNERITQCMDQDLGWTRAAHVIHYLLKKGDLLHQDQTEVDSVEADV